MLEHSSSVSDLHILQWTRLKRKNPRKGGSPNMPSSGTNPTFLYIYWTPDGAPVKWSKPEPQRAQKIWLYFRLAHVREVCDVHISRTSSYARSKSHWGLKAKTCNFGDQMRHPSFQEQGWCPCEAWKPKPQRKPQPDMRSCYSPRAVIISNYLYN